MAINIAKMSATLSATAAGFAANFKGAEKSVNSFKSTFSSMGAKIAAVGAAIGAGAAVAGMVALVKGQLDAIDSTAKLSDSLGISTKELSQLQYAASYSGTSMEDLDAALVKMVKTRPGKSFAEVADEITAIQNPTNRAQAAFAIFGKSWAKVMPLLAEGSEGLKKAGIEADAMGYSFDRVDAAQVEAANDAIQKVKNVIVGVGTQLAIKLAPFITEAADRLSGMALAGDGMAKTVVNGFEMVVTAVAGAADFLDLLKAGWQTLRGIAGLALLGIIGPLNLVIQGIDWLVNKLTGSSTAFAGWSQALTDALVVETEEAFKQAGESFQDFADGKNAGKVGKFFDDLRAKSKAAGEAVAESKPKGPFIDPEDTKAVEDAAKKIEELRKQVEQFGMSKGDKVADDLRRAGATSEQQAEAKGLQNQLDALEAQKKAHEDATEAAKKYYEETMTPAEKYAAEIEKINELVIKGMLDQETAQRAADAAKQQLKKDLVGGTDIEAPKLLQAGTQEAQSFITQVQNRQKTETVQNEILAANVGMAKTLTSIDRKIPVGANGETFDF